MNLRISVSRFEMEFNAIIVYALRIGGAFFTFLLQVILARWMGAHEYGVFALAWSCVIILGEFLSLGFYNLIQRLIPQYRVAGDMPHLRGALWGAAAVIAIATITVSLLLSAALYGAELAGLIGRETSMVLIIGAASLPAFALSDYLSGICRSYGWMIRAFSPTAIFRPLAIIFLLAGLIALGAGAEATTAMAAATIAVWVTLLASLIAAIFSLPEEVKYGPRSYQLKPWIFAALPMMMISSLELLLFNVDVLMISYFLPPDQTGLYFAATKIMALVAFLNFAVGSAFNGRYAEYHARDDKAALGEVINRSASLIFYPSLCLILGILLFRQQLLGLFGDGFKEAEVILIPLAIGLACRAFVGPGERILMMTGQQKLCALIYGGTVLIDICLNALLIPRYGIIGAAIATSIAFAIMALMLHTAMWHRHQLQVHPISPFRLANLFWRKKPV